MPSPRVVYRARWVLPGIRTDFTRVQAAPVDPIGSFAPGDPIRDGAVAVRDGIIEDVGPATRVAGASKAVDLGDAAILPGFVNAHAHLELTPLRGEIPFDGGFVAWIRRIVERKRSLTDDHLSEGAAQGAQELLRNGYTTVADHATRGASWRPLADIGLRGVCLVEFVGFSRAMEGDVVRMLADRLRACPDTDRLRMGLAPHSPYAVSPELLRRAAELARGEGRTLSIHLSEVLEEITFLQTGTGPLQPLMVERGMWEPAWTPPKTSPATLARSVGLLGPSTLAVHANYLSAGDLDRIGASGATVVYCPNSHAFFGHPQHPFPRYRDRGVPVAIGTDSLASNEALDPRRELRTARERFPRVPARALLHAATAQGARALGLEDRVGALSPGLAADLVAIPVPAAMEADGIEEAVISSTDAPRFVCIAGRPRLGPGA